MRIPPKEPGPPSGRRPQFPSEEGLREIQTHHGKTVVLHLKDSYVVAGTLMSASFDPRSRCYELKLNDWQPAVALAHRRGAETPLFAGVPERVFRIYGQLDAIDVVEPSTHDTHRSNRGQVPRAPVGRIARASKSGPEHADRMMREGGWLDSKAPRMTLSAARLFHLPLSPPPDLSAVESGLSPIVAAKRAGQILVAWVKTQAAKRPETNGFNDGVFASGVEIIVDIADASASLLEAKLGQLPSADQWARVFRNSRQLVWDFAAADAQAEQPIRHVLSPSLFLLVGEGEKERMEFTPEALDGFRQRFGGSLDLVVDPAQGCPFRYRREDGTSGIQVLTEVYEALIRRLASKA